MAHLSAEIEVWGTVLFIDAASVVDDADEIALQIGIDKVRDFAFHVDEVFSTYKSDSVISQLESGAKHVQINAAGDLTLRGGHFDTEKNAVVPWSIGVVNPENRQEIVQVFEIMDGAIATSGTYERGAHILDPHTGLIAIGARSATVIGIDGGLTDALATALMVEGRDGAIWFSQPELAEYSAWVVDRHEDVAWSVGPESLMR